jgi:ribosome-associated toxin RatA of RatAB toxin-antitoxin module
MTRGLLIAAAVSVCVPALGARLQAPVEKDAPADLVVAVERGTYSVTARFDVPEPPGKAMAVLTDYEEIPRFMPGVRTSVILERTSRHVTVEQEAVSEYMMFSKNVHLVLEVSEDGDTLRFVDRAHDSFMVYEGTWHVIPKEGGTGGSTITYAVTARPTFDVPGFILKRLLRRDSREMVASLRREISRASGEESR